VGSGRLNDSSKAVKGVAQVRRQALTGEFWQRAAGHQVAGLPNQRIKPTTLSKSLLRSVSLLVRSGSRLLSLR